MFQANLVHDMPTCVPPRQLVSHCPDLLVRGADLGIEIDWRYSSNFEGEWNVGGLLYLPFKFLFCHPKFPPIHLPSRELTYPPDKVYLKMIIPFPRWDMLIPWRVYLNTWGDHVWTVRAFLFSPLTHQVRPPQKEKMLFLGAQGKHHFFQISTYINIKIYRIDIDIFTLHYTTLINVIYDI